MNEQKQPITVGPVESAVTLRDYFAARALQGLISGVPLSLPASQYAKIAYAFADSMLAARTT